MIKKIRLKIFAGGARRNGVVENIYLQNQEDRKSDDGPPDIEQLWRDFNRWVNRFFGGGGRGPGITFLLIIVIVAVLWLFTGLFIVQEGQTGVVMMLGKFDRTAQPGLNWRWPYPIQSHEIVDMTEERSVEIGSRGAAKDAQPNESLMLTADENLVDVQAVVRYKISSAADWVFSNSDPEETVRQIAESSVRGAIGRIGADSALDGDHKRTSSEIQQSIQQALDSYHAGVQVVEVTLQGVHPPAQVRTEFEDAAKAEQDRQRQKSEGQAYADDLIPRAQASASHLIAEAEAYRDRAVNEAEGQSARFRQVLAEYRKAPGVTRDRMYLETMQQILTNTTKVVTDGKGGSNVIYLPLDKLTQQQAQAPAEVPAPPKPSAAPPAAAAPLPSPVPGPAQENVQTVESHHPKSDNRSREDADSREREAR